MRARDFWATRGPTTGTGSKLVTPSDTVDLQHADGTTQLAVALYVTGAGDVCFIGPDGQTDTWTVPANFYLTLPVKRVKATGTTCTNITSVY